MSVRYVIFINADKTNQNKTTYITLKILKRFLLKRETILLQITKKRYLTSNPSWQYARVLTFGFSSFNKSSSKRCITKLGFPHLL